MEGAIFASFTHTEGVIFNEYSRSLEYRKKRTIICNQRKEWGGFKFWIRHFWTVSRPTCTEIVSSSSDHFDEMKKRLAACPTVCFFSKHPPTTTAALRLLLRGLMSQLMQRYEHQPDFFTNLFQNQEGSVCANNLEVFIFILDKKGRSRHMLRAWFAFGKPTTVVAYKKENISLKWELPALLPLSFKREEYWSVSRVP